MVSDIFILITKHILEESDTVIHVFKVLIRVCVLSFFFKSMNNKRKE